MIKRMSIIFTLPTYIMSQLSQTDHEGGGGAFVPKTLTPPHILLGKRFYIYEKDEFIQQINLAFLILPL